MWSEEWYQPIPPEPRRRRMSRPSSKALPRLSGTGRPEAVLFDRDATLIEDVPYNADPDQVRPVPGAPEALDLLRAHGVPLGVVSNQSGVARGLLTLTDVHAVRLRVEELLGPFAVWAICPHGPEDGCRCRKPAPGLIEAACARLRTTPARTVVIGDIGADLDAARAAGARGILVPTPATRPAETAAAAETAPDLPSAVRQALGPPVERGPHRAESVGWAPPGGYAAVDSANIAGPGSVGVSGTDSRQAGTTAGMGSAGPTTPGGTRNTTDTGDPGTFGDRAGRGVGNPPYGSYRPAATASSKMNGADSEPQASDAQDNLSVAASMAPSIGAPSTARAARRPDSPSGPRTLVVRLDSAGDVLLAGPAVRAVAAGSAHTALLCGPQGEPAARLLPGPDGPVDVLVHEAPWVGFSPLPASREATDTLLDRIAAERFDGALVLTSARQSPLPAALLLKLAGVPWVAADSEHYPGALLDLRHQRAPHRHEAEAALDLASSAGFALPPGDEGALRVTGIPDVSKLTSSDRYVVLHPGSAVPARSWSPERAARAVRALAAAGHRVVVTGGAGDAGLTASVSGRYGHDLGGRTSLAELAGVLAGADAVIVGNTGPAHLAAAVGTPVVSLFAPVVPAERWLPFRVPLVRLGQPDAPCAGSRARVCPVPGHPCLDDITDKDLLAAVDRLSPARFGATAPAASRPGAAPPVSVLGSAQGAAQHATHRADGSVSSDESAPSDGSATSDSYRGTTAGHTGDPAPPVHRASHRRSAP